MNRPRFTLAQMMSIVLFIGPIPKPHLLIDKGLTFLLSYMMPPGGFDIVHDQVSHSLQIITFALLGTIVAHFLAAEDA
jgi:hypothetical protein